MPIDGVHRTFVGGLDAANADEPLFHTEAFGPVLAQTALPGADAAEFLRNAVVFANEKLHGTLGASILIHPRTMRELGGAFDDAVAALRYGCVAVNTWPGVGFTLATATWGAFPGNTVADVGSGIGIVHNAYLFDKPQKTVVRAPFAPFPRSLATANARCCRSRRGSSRTAARRPWAARSSPTRRSRARCAWRRRSWRRCARRAAPFAFYAYSRA